MVAAVVLITLLLVQSGFSAPAEQNCSAALGCYTRLRRHFQDEINGLPGLDPEGEGSNVEYKRFCGTLFPPVSPCGAQRSFKNCSTHPDIEKRERVYVQLRGFVCGGNDRDWKRFQAILSAQVSDPCKGAMQAVRDVLRNETAKCGLVRKFFNECASQQRLPTEVLEPGMELLGCKDAQPKLTTPPSPGTQPYTPPACKVNDVWNCLDGQVRHLATGLGLEGGHLISEEESCSDQKSCLDQRLLEGCSISDTLALSVRQATIDAVRRTACENGKAILKGIRSAASCFDAVAFRACLVQSGIRLGNAASKEQCDSAFTKTNKCIVQSAKPCFPADQVKNANKLTGAYLGIFGCASTSSDPATPIPGQKKGKGNGSSLVSTSAVAISVGLAATFALRH